MIDGSSFEGAIALIPRSSVINGTFRLGTQVQGIYDSCSIPRFLICCSISDSSIVIADLIGYRQGFLAVKNSYVNL